MLIFVVKIFFVYEDRNEEISYQQVKQEKQENTNTRSKIMNKLVLKVNDSEEKVFEAETREDLDRKVDEYVEENYLTTV